MTEREISPVISQFIDRLERLDPGGKARLKRCAGTPFAEARGEALGLFFRVLPPGLPEYVYEAYFLVATLYPLAEGGASGDFGASLHRARQIKNSKGLDRRVEVLLDTDDSQLPFRLRQAVHFLQSNRVKVNWPRLLDDLLAWNLSYKPVQRRWAQSYYAQ